MSEVIVQTIRKSTANNVEAGIIYYSFMAAINGISITPKEIKLLAYINSRGTISTPGAKKEFCVLAETTENTINNMVSKLYALKLLVKQGNKTRVHPSLRIDFSKDVVIRMFINREHNNKETDEQTEDSKS